MTILRLAFAGLLATVVASTAAAQADRQEPIRSRVRVPSDAQVEFDGYKTNSGGESRRYEAPPLSVGEDHTYVVAVTSQGKTFTHKISVRSGADNTFGFREGANQQGKNDSADADNKQSVTCKATQRQAAATINFRKELKLPFDSLRTLGSRINAARRKPDPVALAHASSELAVAEKVSDKKASLTSTMLAKEAAELAGMRRQEQELMAVLNVKQQMMMEENDILTTKKHLAMTQAQIKADKEAWNSNQEPTWKPRTVVVNNYTMQYLDIYVTGSYKTQVQPGMQQTIIIEHRWTPTVLKAYGNEDVDTWGPCYIWGRFDKYSWNIQ
jgi:uncharacterized protein (TIGR03000 family)